MSNPTLWIHTTHINKAGNEIDTYNLKNQIKFDNPQKLDKTKRPAILTHAEKDRGPESETTGQKSARTPKLGEETGKIFRIEAGARAYIYIYVYA